MISVRPGSHLNEKAEKQKPIGTRSSSFRFPLFRQDVNSALYGMLYAEILMTSAHWTRKQLRGEMSCGSQ